MSAPAYSRRPPPHANIAFSVADSLLGWILGR